MRNLELVNDRSDVSASRGPIKLGLLGSDSGVAGEGKPTLPLLIIAQDRNGEGYSPQSVPGGEGEGFF